MTEELQPEEILLNLNIISQIRDNEKLSCPNTNSLSIDTSSSFFQPLSRFFRGDGRIKTIEIISKVVEDALIYTDQTLKNELNKIKNKNNKNESDYFYEDNSHILHRFLLNMKTSIKGLENLRITYTYDVPIQSKITLLIEKLQMRVDKMDRLLKISIDNILETEV